MNKRVLHGVLIVSVVLAVLTVQWFFSADRQLRKKVQQSQASTPSLASAPPAPLASNIPLKDLEAMMRKGLEAWGEKIQRGGAKIVPPPSEQLQTAVASGDKGTILRAFHDVVYSRYKRSEVILALKEFLNDAGPFVRYEAAESLLVVGDRSGYTTLLGLVRANEPIEGIGQDIRIKSARTLAKFREAGAIDSIIDLYEQTKNGELLSALSTLGTQVPEAKNFPFIAYPNTIIEYARTDATRFSPHISSVFQESVKPEVKVAAAWALASMNGDQDATNYLVQQAQAILTNPGMRDGTREGAAKYAAGADAIKYLGALQTPEAKRTLEAALDSQDLSIREIATVNLIFNQGGSEKANQVVAQRLSDGKNDLIQLDLALNIAAQINDPQIQAAGQKFAQQEGSGLWSLWSLYTVDRKNWPIYNWIDNYVVKLNK